MGSSFKIGRKSRSEFNHEERFLEVQETKKIRQLYRAICENPEKKSERGLRKKKEIEIEGKLSEESKKLNSADRIDQLAALRFKAQMGSNRLSMGEIEEISENQMPGMRKEREEIPMGGI